MIIRNDNGGYIDRCAVCGQMSPQDYMVLKDMGEGDIQWVHPAHEGRCGKGRDWRYAEDFDEENRSWGGCLVLLENMSRNTGTEISTAQNGVAPSSFLSMLGGW